MPSDSVTSCIVNCITLARSALFCSKNRDGVVTELVAGQPTNRVQFLEGTRDPSCIHRNWWPPRPLYITYCSAFTRVKCGQGAKLTVAYNVDVKDCDIHRMQTWMELNFALTPSPLSERNFGRSDPHNLYKFTTFVTQDASLLRITTNTLQFLYFQCPIGWTLTKTARAEINIILQNKNKNTQSSSAEIFKDRKWFFLPQTVPISTQQLDVLFPPPCLDPGRPPSRPTMLSALQAAVNNANSIRMGQSLTLAFSSFPSSLNAHPHALQPSQSLQNTPLH